MKASDDKGEFQAHPLIALISENAQWRGQDAYPQSGWDDEHERWLEFLDGSNQLRRYLPRLRGRASQRDEVLAEIGVAYFLSKKCGLDVVEWEPPGPDGRTGDFLVGGKLPHPIFVEVKSPGWEADFYEEKGVLARSRIKMGKFVPNEARSTDSVRTIRRAVAAARGQLPTNQPTLVVLHDDLQGGLNDWSPWLEIGALYSSEVHRRLPGTEKPSFDPSLSPRVSAVGILNVDLPPQGIRYRFSLYRNANVPKKLEIPREPFGGFSIYDGEPS